MNKELKKQIKEHIETLRGYNNYGLIQFVNDGTLSIPNELGDVVIELLNSLLTIDSKEDINNIINEFKLDSEEEFWNIIRKIIEQRIKYKQEFFVFCNMSDIEFEKLFEYILKNYILEYNDLNNDESYNIKHIKIAFKYLNTFVKMIIEDLLSKKCFGTITSDLFGMSQSKIESIWMLINKYKSDLRYIVLIRKFKYLEN